MSKRDRKPEWRRGGSAVLHAVLHAVLRVTTSWGAVRVTTVAMRTVDGQGRPRGRGAGGDLMAAT
jgi:hypothetical protein